MSERVKAYFGMLETLSSEALDRSARELAVRENNEVARLIAHIAEIAERGYHKDLGYPSLFAYCVHRLNLSEGSVYRRTQVAAVCRRFPQILEALATGHLHLTGASLIAPHLTDGTVESLISEAAGKTRREVEDMLVAFAPKEPFQPSVRRQPSRTHEVPGRPSDAAGGHAMSEGPTTPGEPPPAPSAGGRKRERLERATEARYNYRFSAGVAFNENFIRLAEVLGIESPHNHIEEILGQAIEIALDKRDPQRKRERRRAREARKSSPPEEGQIPRPGEGGQASETMSRPEKGSEGGPKDTVTTRYIPSVLRERTLGSMGRG